MRGLIVVLATFMVSACGGGSSSSGTTTNNNSSSTASFDSPLVNAITLDYSNIASESEAITEIAQQLSTVEAIFTQHNSDANAVARADEVIQDGWTIRDYPRLRIDQPIDWGYQPGSDNNYTFSVNSLDFTEILVYAYRDSQDNRYMAPIVDVMLDWKKYNITDNNTNGFKWYDMSTGLRAVQLSYLIPWAFANNIEQNKLVALVELADMHLQKLSDPELKGRGNHLFFQMHGIISLCKNVPLLSRCSDVEQLAYDNFDVELSNQFKPDGMHVEHSPGYHTYVSFILSSFYKSNWYQGELAERIEKPMSLIPWLFHPNGDMVIVGDSEHNDPNLYNKLHQNVRYFTSGGTVGTPPEGDSIGFMDTGYAIFRDPWDQLPLNEHSYLFLTAAFHSDVHKHKDDFTFSWSELGMPIIVDTGKYTLSAGTERLYATSTRAHNTVEISGSNYTHEIEDAYGSALKYFDDDNDLDVGVTVAEVYRSKFALDHSRKLFYRKKNWVLVVDQFNRHDSRNFEYIQWFHLNPEAELIRDNHQHMTFYLPTINKYLHMVDVISTTDKRVIAKGQTEPRMQGWFSPKYEEAIPNYAVGFSRTGQDEKVATLLYLSDKGQLVISGQGSIQDNSLTICWNEEGVKDGVSFNFDGDNSSIAGCN